MKFLLTNTGSKRHFFSDSSAICEFRQLFSSLLFVFLLATALMACQKPKSYSLIERGQAEFKKADFDAAITYFTQVIELQPGDWEAYDYRGTCYSRLNKREMALKDFNKAIELSSNQHAPYLNRGIVLLNSHRYTAAIDDFTKTLEFDANCHEAFYNRGVAYLSTGKISKAQADFEDAVRTDPSCAQALKALENAKRN